MIAQRRRYTFQLWHLIVPVVVFAVLAYLTVPWWTYRSADVVILQTTVKPYGGSGKYLVFTDHGVFENTDTWYYFKFNSSDVQSVMMTPNTKAHITYCGFRVPFFSKYPNIHSVEAK